jgi:hypothetical protein
MLTTCSLAPMLSESAVVQVFQTPAMTDAPRIQVAGV